jgi:hypothetical protein
MVSFQPFNQPSIAAPRAAERRDFIMSTGYEHTENTHTSFESINQHVQSFDMTAFTAAGAAQTSRTERPSATYAVARPILLAVTAIPLIPASWRAALRIFVATLDETTAAFRTGSSDLTAGDPLPGEQVAMEPKLPVG